MDVAGKAGGGGGHMSLKPLYWGGCWVRAAWAPSGQSPFRGRNGPAAPEPAGSWYVSCNDEAKQKAASLHDLKAALRNRCRKRSSWPTGWEKLPTPLLNKAQSSAAQRASL